MLALPLTRAPISLFRPLASFSGRLDGKCEVQRGLYLILQAGVLGKVAEDQSRETRFSSLP